MIRRFCAIVLALAALALPARPAGWTLVWSDEFDGPDNSPPDPAKWNFETGGRGWGNNELETYTARTANARLLGGNLAITALRETYTGSDGVTREFTSARLNTKGRFSQKYGRFEARIKLPTGQGIWPAFWMLGDNIDTAGWPACGEIDIMENLGSEPSLVHGSLHAPKHSGSAALSGPYLLPDRKRLSDDYHIFAVEWEPEAIRFFADGKLYRTFTLSDFPGKTWVFDQPFFLLLNVAVGGKWPGPPDQTTVFPQTMLVDWVRVYARQ